MKKEKDLSKSISGTYFHSKLELAGMRSSIRFCYLLAVGLRGFLSRLNYYHANVHALPDHPTGLGVMRDLFVGTLFAVGVILVVYGHHYT